MTVLFAIAVGAFCALCWASFSIAGHIRSARRRHRRHLATAAELRSAEATPAEPPITSAAQPMPPQAQAPAAATEPGTTSQPTVESSAAITATEQRPSNPPPPPPVRETPIASSTTATLNSQSGPADKLLRDASAAASAAASTPKPADAEPRPAKTPAIQE